MRAWPLRGPVKIECVVPLLHQMPSSRSRMAFEVLLDAGIRLIVSPGGSVRDEEVLAVAQAAGATMYFTGTRHFFH